MGKETMVVFSNVVNSLEVGSCDFQRLLQAHAVPRLSGTLCHLVPRFEEARQVLALL